MAGVDSNPAKRRRKGKNVPPEEKEAERLDAERNAAEAARLEKELFGGTEEDFDAFGREERVEDTPYEGVLGFEDRWGAKGDADEVGPHASLHQLFESAAQVSLVLDIKQTVMVYSSFRC